MGIFDIFKQKDDYEKIETPKTYKINQFYQIAHTSDINSFTLNFNLVAIHNNEDELSFILINTTNIADNSSLYSVQIQIKKDKEDKNKLENKIVLGQGINPNDREGIKLAEHLFNEFKWETKDKYLRSLRTTIDFQNSNNLQLDSLLNKEVEIAVTDASNQNLYKIFLNWKTKKAQIKIEQKQLETFRSIYFVKHEVFVEEQKLSEEIKKTIKVKGFDKDGEPQIQILKSGEIKIQFEFMPPLNGNDNQSDNLIFENFDKELSTVIGKEVIWEDREIFLIMNPQKGDDQKLKDYLEGFWDKINIS